MQQYFSYIFVRIAVEYMIESMLTNTETPKNLGIH